MTVEQWKQWLLSLPARFNQLPVVCGSLTQEDQYVRAAPWEPEEVAVAGVGITKAVVVGFDFSREGLRGQYASQRPHSHRVIRASRKGIGPKVGQKRFRASREASQPDCSQVSPALSRFKLSRMDELSTMFRSIATPLQDAKPRYNIAPLQEVLAITNPPAAGAAMAYTNLQWGLIPSWAKSRAIGLKLFNAEAHVLPAKGVFRDSLRSRRCIVPADGFYLWRRNPDGSKTPVLVQLVDGKPFAFAGLWDEWKDPEAGAEVVRSCTIITTRANALLDPISEQMPVILCSQAALAWLAAGDVPAAVTEPLLRPFPAENMRTMELGPFVNNPSNEGPQCIQRLIAAPGRGLQ